MFQCDAFLQPAFHQGGCGVIPGGFRFAEAVTQRTLNSLSRDEKSGGGQWAGNPASTEPQLALDGPAAVFVLSSIDEEGPGGERVPGSQRNGRRPLAQQGPPVLEPHLGVPSRSLEPAERSCSLKDAFDAQGVGAWADHAQFELSVEEVSVDLGRELGVRLAGTVPGHHPYFDIGPLALHVRRHDPVAGTGGEVLSLDQPHIADVHSDVETSVIAEGQQLQRVQQGADDLVHQRARNRGERDTVLKTRHADHAPAHVGGRATALPRHSLYCVPPVALHPPCWFHVIVHSGFSRCWSNSRVTGALWIFLLWRGRGLLLSVLCGCSRWRADVAFRKRARSFRCVAGRCHVGCGRRFVNGVHRWVWCGVLWDAALRAEKHSPEPDSGVILMWRV